MPLRFSAWKPEVVSVTRWRVRSDTSFANHVIPSRRANGGRYVRSGPTNRDAVTTPPIAPSSRNAGTTATIRPSSATHARLELERPEQLAGAMCVGVLREHALARAHAHRLGLAGIIEQPVICGESRLGRVDHDDL